MADIFLSYASADRSRAEPIAKALEGEGWSVWWDRTIPPGMTFVQVIEKEINEAKCVLVLWSNNSIKSEWVQEEATIGKQGKILVPAKIDQVNPPLGFGLIQAADLTDWKSGAHHEGFATLKNAISRIAPPPPKKSPQETIAEVPKPSRVQRPVPRAEITKPSQKPPGERKPAAVEIPKTRDQLPEMPAGDKKPHPLAKADKKEAVPPAELFSETRSAVVIAFIVFGMLSSIAFDYDNLHIDFSSMQVLFVFLSGYYYGGRTGLFCGALIFLPNLIACYLPASDMVDQPTIFIRQKVLIHLSQYDTINITAFSIISYPIFGSLGYWSASLKERLNLYEKQIPFLNSHHKFSDGRVYWFLLPLYLNAQMFRLTDYFTIYPGALIFPILLLVAFFHGSSTAIKLFVLYSPMVIARIKFGPLSLSGFFSETSTYWLLIGLIFAGCLDSRPQNHTEFPRKGLYVLLLAAGTLISFHYHQRGFELAGYPLAFGIVLTAGYLFGSYRGFWFGFWWAMLTGCITIFQSKYLAFGDIDWMAELAAPFIGYLGGSDMFKGGFLPGQLIRLFGSGYAIFIAILLMSGSLSIYTYLGMPFYCLVSVLSALILYSLFGSLRGSFPSFLSAEGHEARIFKKSQLTIVLASIFPFASFLFIVLLNFILEW